MRTLKAWVTTEWLIEQFIAVIVFGLMIVTVVDVCGRYFFSSPIKAAFELGQIGMALIVFVGLPLITAREEHIIAGVLHERLPRRLESARRLFIDLFCATVTAVLAWRLFILGGELAARGAVTWFLRLPQSPLAYLTSAMGALATLVFVAKALGHAVTPRAPGPPDAARSG